MKSCNEKKAILFGIDGLPPKTLFQFVNEGELPGFERLIARSMTVDMIPTLPATTAPGWLTIASGCSPSRIGVENILLPQIGGNIGSIRNGFDRRYSKAEYLWECLQKQGLPSIVLKYPGSWPPKEEVEYQIDGAGGYADITCEFDLAPSHAYKAKVSDDYPDKQGHLMFPDGYTDYWRIDTGTQGISFLNLYEPAGWKGISANVTPKFEFIIPIQTRLKNSKKILFGLVYQRSGQYKLYLSKNRIFDEAGEHLSEKEWSSWFSDREDSDSFAYRFKLIKLDGEHRTFHLYRSEGHRTSGFTVPDELAEDLLQHVGPVVEWTGTYDLMNGLIDIDTQLEIYQMHADWVLGAIKYLWKQDRARALFTQIHFIEYAHHLVGASLHEDHPLHNPVYKERDMNFLREVYKIADRMLQTLEQLLDPETMLVIASDHGHDLVHTVFYINEYLRQTGYIQLKQGSNEIDWANTKAYALFPGHIFINKRGVWKDGNVPPESTAGICRELVQLLRSVINPINGEHPVKIVLERSDMAAFGLHGEQSPDLFFCLDRGYETATRINMESDDLFEMTVPYQEVTSGHGSFFPVSESARTIAIFNGVNIKSGTYPQTAHLKDIAPTIAHFLNAEPPKGCEGHILKIFEESVKKNEPVKITAKLV